MLNRRRIYELIEQISAEGGWDPRGTTSVTLHLTGEVTFTSLRCPSQSECLDCGNPNPDYYMVRDDVWADAVDYLDGDRQLCLGCLEKRLGRAVVEADFTDIAMNQGHRSRYRYIERQFE